MFVFQNILENINILVYYTCYEICIYNHQLQRYPKVKYILPLRLDQTLEISFEETFA